MILIMLCSISIIFIKLKPNIFKHAGLKIHFKIFLCKLIIISMFIYIFLSNLSVPDSRIFIIVGCFIFVVFHFIEGFIVQKKILKNGK